MRMVERVPLQIEMYTLLAAPGPFDSVALTVLTDQGERTPMIFLFLFDIRISLAGGVLAVNVWLLPKGLREGKKNECIIFHGKIRKII